MLIKNLQIVASIAMLAISGAAFALSLMPEPPPAKITACINFETTKSTLTNDSVKVTSNLVELMNRIPDEFDNFKISYNYHPYHSQPSSTPTSNTLFLKLAFERQQTFFDTIRIHNKAGSKLDTVSLGIGMENTVINFVEPCEAYVQIFYPRGAEKYFCESQPINCKLVKCNVDGCNEQ